MLIFETVKMKKAKLGTLEYAFVESGFAQMPEMSINAERIDEIN